MKSRRDILGKPVPAINKEYTYQINPREKKIKLVGIKILRGE